MQLFKKVLNFATQRHLKTASDLFLYHSDYPGALDCIERVLDVEPDDTRALVLYGDILFCLNRDLDALKALNKALDIDPALVEAYLSKASVLEALGKFREALNCCRQALAAGGAQKQYLLPTLFDQQIILLIRLKRFREAQRVLDLAVGYLEEEDIDYLVSSYKGLLDQFCRQRSTQRRQSANPGLKLISTPA